MFEDSSLEDDTIFQALRHKPWQVDGGIDTNRGEGITAVNPLLQFRLRDFLELSRSELSHAGGL